MRGEDRGKGHGHLTSLLRVGSTGGASTPASIPRAIALAKAGWCLRYPALGPGTGDGPA